MIDTLILKPEADIVLNHYLRLRRNRTEIYHADADLTFAEDTAHALTEGTRALTTYFEIDEPLSVIRAILAPDREAFDLLVADLLGITIERPSDPRRIAQPQRTDIIFLSPSAYETQSAYDYVPEDFLRMVHHELVHVVQEHLSPGIEESPFWWDEGLAVYLSNQWQHASQFRFREPGLDSIREGKAPSLSDIQANPSLGYEFGWTLVRFIEQLKGTAAIVSVVKRMRNGDVLSALGEDAAMFEAAWQTWLLKGAGSKL